MLLPKLGAAGPCYDGVPGASPLLGVRTGGELAAAAGSCSGGIPGALHFLGFAPGGYSRLPAMIKWGLYSYCVSLSLRFLGFASLSAI